MTSYQSIHKQAMCEYDLMAQSFKRAMLATNESERTIETYMEAGCVSDGIPGRSRRHCVSIGHQSGTR